MTYRFIRVSEEAATAVITIDNPPVNALHPDVSDEIAAAARQVEDDPRFRSLVLTGSGRCFVAGGDLKYFTILDRETAAAMAGRTQAMQHTLFELRVPVVAAVNGHALGGGLELALACDIVVAEQQATFGLPEVTLGVIPGAGGTQMLTAALPVGTAKRFIFTGDRFSAEDARSYGLVDQVTETGASLRAALDIAGRINSAAPLAVEAAKKSSNHGLRHSEDDGHRREIRLFSELFDTRDSREGIQAFLDRRAPDFRRE